MNNEVKQVKYIINWYAFQDDPGFFDRYTITWELDYGNDITTEVMAMSEYPNMPNSVCMHTDGYPQEDDSNFVGWSDLPEEVKVAILAHSLELSVPEARELAKTIAMYRCEAEFGLDFPVWRIVK